MLEARDTRQFSVADATRNHALFTRGEVTYITAWRGSLEVLPMVWGGSPKPTVRALFLTNMITSIVSMGHMDQRG